MGIIYLISVIALITSFITIKKTDKELNIISFILITLVLLLCHNVFVCYVLTFITVPITLTSLSIINFVISGILVLLILRKREIQKYKLDKFGLISIAIILVATLIASYLNFGFPLNIKYETGDPSVHYLTSVLFAKQDRLLNLNDDPVHDSFQGRKIGSYVNSGIIMKCLSNVLDEIDFYKIFIIFGIFIFFMTGAIMYSTLEKFAKRRSGKILALIVSIIYVMGYPLNSFLFGFEYLSLGILIIGTIIHMIYYFEHEELKFGYYILIFALLNFNVFCSYYMFVPFIYSALWIYFCIYSKKNNGKIFCKRNLSLLGITLLIPFFLGYIYHLAPAIYNILNLNAWEALMSSLEYSSGILNHSFTLYGYIYINFYSNMILFVPLTIYYIIKKFKNKEIWSFEIIGLIFLLIFMGILGLGVYCKKVSVYFLMKNYYILWLFLIYINFRSMMYISEKNKLKPYPIILFYLLLVILNLIFVDAPLKNKKVNENESIQNLVEIFGVNKTILTEKEIDYTPNEIELLKYARDNLDFSKDKIEFLGESEQLFWEYSLLRYVSYEDILDDPIYSGQQRLTLKSRRAERKIGEVDYMVYFKRSTYFMPNEKKLFEAGTIIYENEAGGIVKFDKDK